MFHRLSTLAAVASLVLCVATCVLWVRSYRTGFVVRYVTAGGYGACVGSIPGVLGTGVEAGPPPPPTGPRWVAGWLRWNSGRTRHDRLTSGDVQPPGGVYGFYAERRLAESDRRSPGWERRALAGVVCRPGGVHRVRASASMVRRRRPGDASDGACRGPGPRRPTDAGWNLPRVRVRPPRHARPVPGVRGGVDNEIGNYASPMSHDR